MIRNHLHGFTSRKLKVSRIFAGTIYFQTFYVVHFLSALGILHLLTIFVYIDLWCIYNSLFSTNLFSFKNVIIANTDCGHLYNFIQYQTDLYFLKMLGLYLLGQNCLHRTF